MMQLTRTFGPYSIAYAIVIALSPAFAAAYGATSGVGRIEATLDTLMIAPPSPAAIRDPNSADRRNGPLRFTPITLSNRSSLVSTDDGASAAPSRVTLVGEPVAVLPFPDVYRMRRRIAAERADFRDGRLARVELAAGNRQVRARVRETQRHRMPQAA